MKNLVAATILFCACAIGQPQPASVAIRNAKIVTVSGPVIAKGTVVLRNGLIEAVGDNVQAPADALVIDGEGLTVYPGLVDGLSTWGMPVAAAAGRGGRGATGAPVEPRSMGPEDRPSTTSWIKAADEIQPGDARIRSGRSAGFTTAIVFPTRGIFGGQGSAINLGGEKAEDMVLVPSVGQYITMGHGPSGGYPDSLMGSIAYIRQIYLDADHYKLVKTAYDRNPRGMKRPDYDRALEGVIESKRILLPAQREVEMDRMLRFGAELKQPTVLYGMREGYRAAAVLKKGTSPVLISLKWGEKARDSDPDEVDTMRTLENRAKGPTTPQVLKQAGVKFAFYTDGVDSPREIQRAVKKAIDAGLSREDAVRALTMSPAEIYGISDRLGSIEKGKIANLTVTRGEIFDDRTKVEMVFIDGVKYTPSPEAAGRGNAATENPGGQK